MEFGTPRRPDRAPARRPARYPHGVPLPRPSRPDALRPSEAQALAAWRHRVLADREQVERCREVADPDDFYAPTAARFAQDPDRSDDLVLDALLALAEPGEAWLDIGAGGGRYALPLARRVREVLAIDPSPAMLAVLRASMAEHGIANVRMIQGRWPDLDGPIPRAEVALMAHVGYDIEAIGPFLAAAQTSSSRLCVAVVGESAMTTAANLLWEPVHGETRVPLPALPELLTLLLAADRLPTVTLAPRTLPVYGSPEDLLAMTRRQLWVRAGSAKDELLVELLTALARETADGWTIDPHPGSIGIVSWRPSAA